MKGKKILIVEDETTMQKLLKEVLEEKEFSVVVASNGEEGIVVAKKEIPDLIVLDIILPKKDGFEFLEELKNTESIKNIPVILLTNLNQPQDVQRAVDLGAKTYLVKSDYELSDVVRKIEEALKA